MKTITDILKTFSQFILTFIVILGLLLLIDTPKSYSLAVIPVTAIIYYIWNYKEVNSFFFKK